MKCRFFNLKINKFFKFYLLIISLLNLTYIVLETYSFKLGNLFSSLGTDSLFTIKETYPMEFTMRENIQKINNAVVYLILLVSLFCLLRIIMKKFDSTEIKQFLIVNSVYLLFAVLISYILSAVFLAPIGNLMTQLISVCEVTAIVLICCIVKILYGKVRLMSH